MTGWKEIRVKLADLTGTRYPSWDQMTAFRLVAHGDWSMVGNPETDLYIGSVKVSGFYIGGMDFVNDFYNIDVIEEVYASLKDSVAAYAGGVNVVNFQHRKLSKVPVRYKLMELFLQITIRSHI